MDLPVDPITTPDGASEVRPPPKHLWGALRYLGPGLILSAAIVGSGELIATTTLGAQAGFALLWVILLGCTVKVAVQIEYGRMCIQRGWTTLQAWNQGSAGKWRGLHWSVGLAAVYMVALLAGQAGVLGGAAQVAGDVAPVLPLAAWVFLLAALIGGCLATGRYQPVETVATLLNLLFIGAVFYCVVAVQRSPDRVTIGELAGGLTLRFPPQTLGLAVAAFGITGVAAGEIAVYPYWCLEKGYARWTGPRTSDPAWAARARGWTRVMTLDALVSMAVYTLATCGFYFLGAAVLRHAGTLQDGNDFVLQLSALFTRVAGDGARSVFLLCAFAVLFSTVFANAAGFSRVWADFFGLVGWMDWTDTQQRRRWIAGLAVLFPILSGMVYLAVQLPLFLVTFMGLCNALFLAVVGYQAVRFRYRHTDPALRPGRCYDTALWISLIAIGFMACRALTSLVHG